MRSSGNLSPTFETMPSEILERIALYVGTSELKGPPVDLAALCLVSRPIYSAIASQHAPSLYAAVFSAKFDVAPAVRRLGPVRVTKICLATELPRRFATLKRFLTRTAVSSVDLWTAIFMMLENHGTNEVQLRDYAQVDTWLREYLLDTSEGAGIMSDLEGGIWPRDTQEASLSLWLLGLCYINGPRDELPSIRHRYSEVLRAYALGAPQYPVTYQSWLTFDRIPGFPNWERVEYTYYGITLKPTAPAISVSAILGYAARVKSRQPIISNSIPAVDLSLRWDSDWARCVGAPNVHRPGALEGIWEGPFTYTEFSVYAAILAGGPPQMLHDGAIGQNLQVWRLREYHLFAKDRGFSEGLPPGDVLDAFFPINTTTTETEDEMLIKHASKEYVYTRGTRAAIDSSNNRTLCDVVVFGEGHSSWGTFKLRGRVRTSDAFVTVLKEYNGSADRGRWLYRGYLVGGKLIGRWRDSFSPSNVNGYEGCFELDQRI